MRNILALTLVGAACLGAPKGPPTAQAANDKIIIKAILYADRASLRQEVGSDLGGYYTVVRVEITARTQDPLVISPDDFLLRSLRDGQRSGPLAPSQIAGRGTLVVSSKGGGGLMAENPGPVWGGWPGPPRRLGGESAVVGNASESTPQASAQDAPKGAEDPLLATLKAKALPGGTHTGSTAGLLYFLLEGRHKPSQLELLYEGPAGKLGLRFR